MTAGSLRFNVKPQEALLLALIIFSPLMEGGTTYLPVAITRLLIAAIFFIWLWHVVRSKEVLFVRTRLDLPIALFLLLSILSTAFISPYKNMSVQWLQSIFSYAVLFYAVTILLDSDKKLERVVRAIAIMGLIEAVLSAIQFCLGDFDRVKGTFFNPNFLAGYLVAALSLCVSLVLYASGRREKALLGLIILLILAAMVLTRSRGGFLALATALSVIIWCRFGKRGVACIAILLVFTLLTPNPLSQRIRELPQTDIYAYSRLDIWRSSIAMTQDHPEGVGLGIFKYNFPRYHFPVKEAIAHYGKYSDTAHSEYLHIGAELGIAGLMIFLWGLWRFGCIVKRVIHLADEGRQRGMAVGLVGGIVGIFTHSMVDVNLHEPSIAVLLAIMAGSIFSLGQCNVGMNRKTRQLSFRFSRFHYVILSIFAILSALLISKPAVAFYFFADGKQLGKRGDLKGAEAAFEKAVLFDAGNTQYGEALAELYFRGYQASGDASLAELALVELDYAERLNPVNYRFPYHKGLIYAQMAKKEPPGNKRQRLLDESLRNYARALGLQPYYPFAYNEMGEILIQQGRYEEAAKNFLYVTTIEPNFLPARLSVAALYEKLSKADLARDEYRRILEVRERYRHRALSDTERRYLQVDEGFVKDKIESLSESG